MHEIETQTMTQNERTFIKALGKRIAELRKAQGLTQAQLAEGLGLIQQHVAHFEVGRRRVPVTLLPTLARLLATTVEELVGENVKPARRGPTPQLQQRLERIAQLPRARQRFVLEMLDTVLQQASR